MSDVNPDSKDESKAAKTEGVNFSERYSDVMGKVNESLNKIDWTQMGKYGKAAGIIAVVVLAQVLIKIVIDTVETPTSLDSVTRTISNGACQTVASTITTLYQIITGTINSASYLDSIERNPVPLGLEFGPSINANATSTNSYLHFEFADAVYTTLTRTVDNTITQNTTYPQCVDQANAIRQYFSNISTIIQTGLGTVPRSEPSQLSTALSSRATVFTLTQGIGSNPHDLETGTPIRLVPRPRYDQATSSYVDVDKRFVRLPNGFSTNQKYYVIAPARNTKPENYGTSLHSMVLIKLRSCLQAAKRMLLLVSTYILLK